MLWGAYRFVCVLVESREEQRGWSQTVCDYVLYSSCSILNLLFVDPLTGNRTEAGDCCTRPVWNISAICSVCSKIVFLLNCADTFITYHIAVTEQFVSVKIIPRLHSCRISSSRLKALITTQVLLITGTVKGHHKASTFVTSQRHWWHKSTGRRTLACCKMSRWFGKLKHRDFKKLHYWTEIFSSLSWFHLITAVTAGL